MFARIARYDVPSDRVPEALEKFRSAAAQISELPDLTGGYVLADREDGSVVTVTLWPNRNSLETSRRAARSLRKEAVDAVGGSIVSVVEYEVAAELPLAAS